MGNFSIDYRKREESPNGSDIGDPKLFIRRGAKPLPAERFGGE